MAKGRKESSILAYFGDLPDPRIERCKHHQLLDIIAIGICAVICGADSFVEMEEFGHAKREWFETFLDLENGVPSHDTFRRVFGKLKPSEFQRCFLAWIEAVQESTNGEVIAIDGKALRGTFERTTNRTAIRMVSAWATSNSLVLGQVKTEEKSNEITAIPALLRLLEIEGCIVTIDAMGCQREIVEQIVKQKADYCISLKGNQGILHEEVREYFEWARAIEFKQIAYSYAEAVEKDHGRIEVRRCWSVGDVEWLNNRENWGGLRSICAVEAERFELTTQKQSLETRYFISSLASDAQELMTAVRRHWAIENSLHWVLDVAFGEDHCRIRKDHGAENFAMLRHIAVNLLKREKTAKVGVKIKRNKAAWDTNYLLKVLTG
ncbi:MAG: ISAs1 family transposase [Acidobacteria bacterium]|nr:ISAs1 family transposase [Acidobacteriota bacterium]